MEEIILYIGTIVQIKGFRGGFIVSDLQPEIPALKKGAKVSIGFSQQFSRPYTIENWNSSKLAAQVMLQEIKTDVDAKNLKEMGLFVDKSELIKIDKNFIAIDEIIGCVLYDEESDEKIGEILEVWETPANKVWLVSYQGREVTIPVIEQVVKNIDISNKKILVELMDGLLD